MIFVFISFVCEWQLKGGGLFLSVSAFSCPHAIIATLIKCPECCSIVVSLFLGSVFHLLLLFLLFPVVTL